MIDLQPWACSCGRRFADTHAAITIDTVRHTREGRAQKHVVRKLPRTER